MGLTWEVNRQVKGRVASLSGTRTPSHDHILETVLMRLNLVEYREGLTYAAAPTGERVPRLTFVLEYSYGSNLSTDLGWTKGVFDADGVREIWGWGLWTNIKDWGAKTYKTIVIRQDTASIITARK